MRLSQPKLLQLFAMSAIVLAGCPFTSIGWAAEEPKFSFLAPPHQESLRLFWLNNATGQVGACEYRSGEDEKKIGNTLCFPSGEGAGPVGQGRYALKASNHAKEYSVFRVNVETGDISVCWVRDKKVVCTLPAR